MRLDGKRFLVNNGKHSFYDNLNISKNTKNKCIKVFAFLWSKG